MSYGPSTFDTPEIALEDIICEIIDNSIAANATHIHVQIGNDTCAADGEPSLNFDVFDNGTKIRDIPWTEEHIKKAFEIEYDPNDPPIRATGETGKFHVGMKIAVLSKFDTVSMITLKDENEILQRHGTYPSLERLLEDGEMRYGLSKNPSSSSPETVNALSITTLKRVPMRLRWIGVRTGNVQSRLLEMRPCKAIWIPLRCRHHLKSSVKKYIKSFAMLVQQVTSLIWDTVAPLKRQFLVSKPPLMQF